jgi:tetratricopeptide (TPR) repeat protein
VRDREELARRLAQCDEVLREHSGSADPVAIVHVAVALRDKARILGELERYGDALELWEEILERYGEDPPAGEELIGLEAGYEKAFTLDQLERADEAMAASDEALDRWNPERGRTETLSEADELQSYRYLAATLVVKRRLCSERRRGDEVLAIDEELVGRYAESTDAYLRRLVAGAISSQVYWLLAAHRVDEAIAASQALSDRFQGETEPDMLLRVGREALAAARSLAVVIDAEAGWEAHAVLALTAVASGLRLLNRDRRLWPPQLWQPVARRRRRLDQAERIFDLLTERLDGADGPELAHLATLARAHLGSVRVVSGRLSLGVQTVDAALSTGAPAVKMLRTMADHAIDRTGRSAAWEASAVLFGLGFLHESMGQRAEAAAVYTECIERFRGSRSPAVCANVLVARLSRRTVTLKSLTVGRR